MATCWTPLLLTLAGTLPLVFGQPGDVCMFLQRHCLPEATCDPLLRRCVCPADRPIGNGLFQCVRATDFYCESTADPKILTYSGGKGSLTLPCRHCLTKFYTPLSGGAPPTTHCGVEVFGINNHVKRGRYFEESMEVVLYVGQLGAGGNFLMEHNIFFYLQRHILNYRSTETLPWQEANPYEKDVDMPWHGISISITYNAAERFVTFSFPECDVQIKFRPYAPNERPQKLLPGIGIQAPQAALFGLGASSGFPACLCMVPGANPDLNELAEEQWLNCPKQLYMWAVLRNGPHQRRGPHKVECEWGVWIFKQCKTHEARAHAIQLCGPLMIRHRTLRCLLAKKISTTPMQIFNSCLRYACVQREDACRHMKLYLKGCPVPKTIRELTCNAEEDADLIGG